MKIELSVAQINNTVFFLKQVDLRGSAPEMLVEMASLLTIYGRMLKDQQAQSPANDNKPNRAERRRGKKKPK